MKSEGERIRNVTHQCVNVRSDFISHLPGELLKDVAAVSVQDGDGLGEMMSLSWGERKHDG